MGVGEVAYSSPDISDEPCSLTEIYQRQLPFYLAIGMPYDLFWDGDVTLAKSYREADEIKRKVKNQQLWLQGLYIYDALCKVSPLLHAWSSNAKPLPYAAEPYALTEQEAAQRRQKQEAQKARRSIQGCQCGQPKPTSSGIVERKGAWGRKWTMLLIRYILK